MPFQFVAMKSISIIIRASLITHERKKLPHRHIAHIEIHNRNNYVLTYVPMCLCGKMVFRDAINEVLNYSSIENIYSTSLRG